MVGLTKEGNMNDSLEAEIEEIVDKQLQDLGFIDLCTRIAQKVVERVQKIDEEHSIIKTELNDIEEKLNLIFVDKKPPEAKPPVRKDVIVIEEEEEKPLLERLQEITKSSQNAVHLDYTASPPKGDIRHFKDLANRARNELRQGLNDEAGKDITSYRSLNRQPVGSKRNSSGNLVELKNTSSESALQKRSASSDRFLETPKSLSVSNTYWAKRPNETSPNAQNTAMHKTPPNNSPAKPVNASLAKQLAPSKEKLIEAKTKYNESASKISTILAKTKPIPVTESSAKSSKDIPAEETTSSVSTSEERVDKDEQVTGKETAPADNIIDESYEYKEGDSVLGKPEKSDIWYTAKISRIIVNKYGQKKFQVKFDSGQKMHGTLPGNSLAPIAHPKGSSLNVGSRVVAIRPRDTVDARIQKKYMTLNSSVMAKGEILYAGVVVERACEENKHRFLVFFDDGFAQYMTEKKMHLVILASENVWQDVSVHCREFIKEYLEEFPDRPMLKLKAGLTVQTEWNGKWLQARVIAVDGSLVKMLFDVDKRTEWIYRGSTRLEPLYTELERRDLEALKNKGKKQNKKKKSASANNKKVEPYLEDAITKPCYGISRFSKTDPQGIQQIKEWGPVEETSFSHENEEDLKSSLAGSDTDDAPTPVKVVPDSCKRNQSMAAKRRRIDESSGHGSDSSLDTLNNDSESGINRKFGNKDVSNAVKNSPSPKGSPGFSSRSFQRNSSQSSIESAASDSQLLMRNNKQSRFGRQHSSQSDLLDSRSRVVGLGRNRTDLSPGSEAFANFESSGGIKFTVTRNRTSGSQSGSQFSPGGQNYAAETVSKKPRRNSSQDMLADPSTPSKQRPFMRRPSQDSLSEQLTPPKQRQLLPRTTQQQLVYWNTPQQIVPRVLLPQMSGPRVLVSRSGSSQNLMQDGNTNHMRALITLTHSFPKIRGPHQCSSKCIPNVNIPQFEKRKHNPLSIPLLLGWTRETAKRKPGYHRDIYYRSPCSRRLRNLAEVTKCLLQTNAKNVTIDQFSFDSSISCRDQIPIFKTPRLKIDDISNGMERTPISCVNERNDELPPNVEYISERIIGLGIDMNHDPGFLASCDCKDNCQDRSKCACARLTIDSSDAIDGKKDEHYGYQYRRLRECATTGIYECNRNCSCSATCYNRVVQNGIGVRLQVFMTDHKGWGLRCLDDIPRGTFICTYSGQILNEEMADKEGKDFGDEYLAELDHIEIVEQAKAGYESDVPELREDKKTERSLSVESSNKGYDSDSDESEFEYSSSSESSDSFIANKSDFKELVKSVAEMSTERSTETTPSKIVPEGVIDLTLDSDQEIDEETSAISPKNVSKKPSSFNQMIQRLKTAINCDWKTTNDSAKEKADQTQVKNDNPESSKETEKDEQLSGEIGTQYGISAKNENCSGSPDEVKSNAKEERSVSIEDSNKDTKPEMEVETKLKTEVEIGKSDTEIKSDFKNENLDIETGDLHIETGDAKPEPEAKSNLVVDWNDEVKKAIETIGPKIRKAVAKKSTRSILFQRLAKENDKSVVPPVLENVAANDVNQSIIAGKTFTSPRSSTGGHFARKSVAHRLQITPPGQLQPHQNEPQQQQQGNEDSAEVTKKSTRQLFGEDQCFVIDAKSFGNVGRYLNHSCMPNLFVQNIFTDTHDLRFPLVAFFAQQNIPALTELTWDYSYDVGSVPGKVLQCYCGSIECRGRLL